LAALGEIKYPGSRTGKELMMKINPFVFGVIVLAIFLGVIFGFQGAGVWSTSGKVGASGERIQPSAADVNTIKGWMTLEQVSTAFSVPIADIVSAFNLPAATPASTALKDLESDSFDIPALRAWLQERQSKP
jgi:hypothetical protein